MEFLDIPDSFKQLVLNRVSEARCQLNDPELCVAEFIRRINQSEHKRSKALEYFGERFFASKKPISSQAAHLLIRNLVPLCGYMSIGSKALTVLDKLLRTDYYRHSESMRSQFLSLELKALKDSFLDLHVTGNFPGSSASKAFRILKMIKEYYESSDSLLHFILNNNTEAIQTFYSWEVSEPLVKPPEAKEVIKEWKSLNTELYEGDLKFYYRYEGERFLMKREICIAAPVKAIFDLILNPSLRMTWDKFNQEVLKLHEEENKSYYWFGFLSDKNEKLDMALKCVTNIFPHYASIHFFSVDSPRIPRREGYKRMNCNNFLYEIRALGVETRRSSSDTDIDSNSSDDSPRSSSSDFRKQKSESDFLCKLSITQDIEPELAKKICGEFSEETTRIKKSLSVLKEVAEKGLTDCAESKNYNSLYESLQRKSLKFRRRHSKVV